MTTETFGRALSLVLRHEGGYVDHPADPGGATNRGITLATLSAWRGRPVTKAEVKALTVQEAGAIYRATYWSAVKGDDLPAGLDYAVFDFAVNSGPARAAKHLQALVGTTTDGVIGPKTLAAAKSKDPADLIRSLTLSRLEFLSALPTWKTFGKGWRSRVLGVEKDALAMAGKPIPVLPLPEPVQKSSVSPAVAAALAAIVAALVGLAAALGVDADALKALIQ